MWKKLFILLAIAGIAAVALIPLWSSKMADNAFDHPNSKQSPEIIKKALLVKMRINEYKGARILAEKAIIYFPESRQLPYFIYNAAMCGEQEGKSDIAIYWYGRFVKKYPKHDWTTQAQNKLNKLKGMHNTL
jgi:outer membrane protein assembly factor BamD (BamD/ComL family)